MEKTERHHIKENDFQLIMEQGYDWLQKYKREVLYGVGIVVAMVVLWYGWNAFSGSRESHASQLLAQALGGEKVDMEKVKRVASKYSGLPAGRSAQALLTIQEGKAPKETAAALEDLIPKVKDATFKGVLIFNAVLLTAEGGDPAGSLKMLETYKDQVPGEMALLLQGRVLEIQGKNDEARALYNRMMKEYPESTLRYMAQQRMNVL
jgi:predicted negative regulator of RcsB-dependent stress response